MTRGFTLDPAYLFENGKASTVVSPGGGVTYNDVGNGAYWEFTTSARVATLTGYCTAIGPTPCLRIITGGILTDRFYATPQVTGLITARLWMPVGTNKTVQLHVPAQYATSAGGAPVGYYPISLIFDQDATLSTPSLQASHVVIYGDSIASGGVGVCPTLFGYAGLMKRRLAFGGYDGSVTQVTYGFRRLADDCSSSGARTAFATFIASLSPTKFLSVIGSNDWAVVPPVSLANFTTYFTGMLDALHSAMPTLPMTCASPIIRPASPATNSLGASRQDFADVISTAVTARSGWSVPPTYLDGQPICISGDLPDGVHPGTAGNLSKMLPAVLAAL